MSDRLRRPRLKEGGGCLAQSRNYRYVIMTMIVLMVIVNYVDRGAISYASKPIIQEFRLNAQTWGEVLSYFGYGYMLGALVGGALADRLGPKRVWLLFGTLWSLFEIGTAYAGNLGVALFGGSALLGFAVFRVLFGFAEGPTFSTVNRTMANWAAPKEKGFAASLGLLGTPVGGLLTAPVAVALLSVTGNWRLTFVVLGLLGILWVLVWNRVFTDKPEEHPRVSRGELAEIRSSKDLLANETTLAASEQEHAPWWHFFL
ncbi:MAG: MFS transporter, partial [Alicyclobacillus sp.]|nr:MFS transporter [Alicyclobacillus sp.]